MAFCLHTDGNETRSTNTPIKTGTKCAEQYSACTEDEEPIQNIKGPPPGGGYMAWFEVHFFMGVFP